MPESVESFSQVRTIINLVQTAQCIILPRINIFQLGENKNNNAREWVENCRIESGSFIHRNTVLQARAAKTKGPVVERAPPTKTVMIFYEPRVSSK